MKTRQFIYSNDHPVKIIFSGLALTTLYFQTNLLDPFNSPKMWIILLLSSWLAGYVYYYRGLISSNKVFKTTFVLISIFILSAFVVSSMSENKYIAIFGDTQRRNGLISYVSLSIIFLVTTLIVRFFNVNKLFFSTYLTSLLLVIYGFLQTIGKDFISWINPHNSLIGTLGNPNFAAAAMAIMGVLVFATLFLNDFTKIHKILAFTLIVFLLLLIYRSGARQGLLSFILGSGVFLLIWAYKKNKTIGMISIILAIFVLSISILGMLQIGPLERVLYKPSVSVRGFYWRAGFEMFVHNKLFGVGMDNYGGFFPQYREVGYPLTYGFDITSSNAHNTFIQFFATGGLFLGLSYIAIQYFVLRRATVGIRKLEGNQQLLYSGIFSAWVAFHAQSFVSIDNIGVSIWGWILGGCLIGLSSDISKVRQVGYNEFLVQKNHVDLKRSIISLLAFTLAIIPIVDMHRAERSASNAGIFFNSQDRASVEYYRQIQLKALDSRLMDPNYSVRLAQNLIQAGYVDDGIKALKDVLDKDPRNIDALTVLAITYEYDNKFSAAIYYREIIAKINPWNAVNYLNLGLNYKKIGEVEKSREMLDKILSFSIGVNGGPIAQQAKLELS